MRRNHYLVAGTFSLGCILVASSSVAQEVGGLQAFATFRQSLIYSDNPDLRIIKESETVSRTDLTLGFLTETRATRFRFEVGGAFEFGDRIDGDNTDFLDPSAELSFARTAGNAALSGSALYSESDVSDVILEDTTAIGGDILNGTGTREVTDLRLRFDGGLESPFSYGFDVRRREIDFSVTTDPDLIPETEIETNIRLGFQVSPQLSLGVVATDINFDADDAVDTQRDTTRIAINGNYQVRDGLSLNFGVNDSEVTTVRTFGTSVTDGIGGELGFLLDRPNGTLAGTFTTIVEDSGRIDTLSFTRALDLRAGTLSFGAGLVDTPSGGTDPLFNIAYTQELPNGMFDLSLSQVTTVNDDSIDVINSRLSLGYSQPINNVSGWDATLSIADTNVVGVDDDTSRIDLTFAYRRDLGPDWDLVSRYTYAKVTEDGVTDRDSNTIGISLERGFSFRP